jgi:hypothetical protein
MGAPIKGGFVLVDSETGAVERVLAFQYNPDQLAYSVTAAATEIELTCGFDATDELAVGDPGAQQSGIAPQLAALAQLAAAPPPPDGPVIVFVWGAARVAAAEISSLTITEHAFNERLSPLRATVAIGLRLLRAGAPERVPVPEEFALAYEASQQRLASSAGGAALSELGLTNLR